MADLTITAKNVKPLPGAEIVQFQAAVALAVGDLVYLNSSGNVDKADTSSSAKSQAIGVVVSGGKDTTSFDAGDKVDVLVRGRVAGFAGATIGTVVYSSATAAKIATTAPAAASGKYKWIVGRPLASGVILIDPFTDDTAAQ